MSTASNIRLLVIAFAILALFGCEKDTPETTGEAQSSAESASSPSAEVQGGSPADEGSEQLAEADPGEEREPPDRKNGRAIADPKGYDNPSESELGTLPDGVGLAPGTKIPSFSATDVNQQPPAQVTSESLLAEGPVLMVFYRGGW